MNAAEITDKLGLHSLRHRNWYIQATCATSGDGLYEGLDWLANQLKNKKWGAGFSFCGRFSLWEGGGTNLAFGIVMFDLSLFDLVYFLLYNGKYSMWFIEPSMLCVNHLFAHAFTTHTRRSTGISFSLLTFHFHCMMNAGQYSVGI